MKGAIIGDVVGSIYEAAGLKTKRFQWMTSKSTFTDDTVCTIAVAEALLTGTDPASLLQSWGKRYPDAGFGPRFREWLNDPAKPRYNSLGNGGPMRVSACGHLARTLDEAMQLSDRVTSPTHGHPEAMLASRVVAGAVWMARHGASAAGIRTWSERQGRYDLGKRLDEIRRSYGYDITSKGTVPPALIAALEAKDFEDAIRNAVSLGGDADTLAAIAGSVAEPLFGIPTKLWQEVRTRLPAPMVDIVDRVYATAPPVERGMLKRLARLWS